MKTTLLLSVLCAVMAAAASITCGSEICATDEFCKTAGTACQCNSTLYPFVRGSRPSPTYTCTGGKFNTQVSKCWLEKNGYNTSDIRLDGTDPKCFATREVVNGTSEMTIHRPLTASDCSTQAVTNATHVTYTNRLSIFAKKFPIQTANDAFMSISCTFPLSVNVGFNVPLRPVIGTTVINDVTGNGSYVATMLAYTDSAYTTPLTESSTLTVEDLIYLSVVVGDLDVKTFKLKVVNIYASATNSSGKTYYLLKDGCPASDVSADQLSVGVNGNGSESRFPMKVFKIASSNAVYLYADLALCTTDCNSTCSSTQSKSDVSQNIEGKVSIYLDASDTIYNLDASSASGFSMPWTLSALIFSWILMKLM